MTRVDHVLAVVVPVVTVAVGDFVRRRRGPAAFRRYVLVSIAVWAGVLLVLIAVWFELTRHSAFADSRSGFWMRAAGL